MHHYKRGSVRVIGLMPLAFMCFVISTMAVTSPPSITRGSDGRLQDSRRESMFTRGNNNDINKPRATNGDTRFPTTTAPATTTVPVRTQKRQSFAELDPNLDYFSYEANSQEASGSDGNAEGLDVAQVQAKLDECKANLSHAQHYSTKAPALQVAIKNMCYAVEKRIINRLGVLDQVRQACEVLKGGRLGQKLDEGQNQTTTGTTAGQVNFPPWLNISVRTS